MNLFENWQASPLEVAFGWALIHFLWQGAIIATLLAAVLELLRSRSANLRYLAACGALVLMAAAPLFTTVIIARSATENSDARAWRTPEDRARTERGREAGKETDQQDAPPGETWTKGFGSAAWTGRAATVAVAIWLLGVLFFSLRLFVAWRFTERLKSEDVRPVDDGWRRRLEELRIRLRVERPVRLLESALVTVPTAIGWLRPVILLPASSFVGLTPAQLEAILAHELAHLRRYDYLINLAQTMVETLLFYHPAVWWVSRRIRHEREDCCDDLAVAICGDPIAYARALLEMETLRAASPQLAVAANGGVLMKRIHRLVGVETQTSRRFGGLIAVALAAATIVSVGVGATRLFPPQDQEPKKSSPSARVEQKEMIPQNDRAVEALAPALKGALTDRDEQVRKNAAETIELIKEAKEDDGAATREPSFDLSTLTMSQAESLSALQSKDPLARAGAACRLGKLGAKDAIPALIDLLGDDATIQPLKCWGDGDWGPARAQFKQSSPGEQAALALASIGQPVGESLLAALSSGNAVVRRNAAWAIGEMRGGHSTDRGAAIDPLVVLLHDADAWVRAAAAFSLGEIRPSGLTEPLIASLGDDEWFVREMAIYALGEMKARAAVEPLRALLLREENDAVRRKAAWALREISE